MYYTCKYSLITFIFCHGLLNVQFLLLHYKNVLKMARIKRKASHFPEKKCLSEDSCHYYLYLIEYMQDSVLYLVVGSVVTEVPGDE